MKSDSPAKVRGLPQISVVVISRNEGKYLRRTVENLEDTLPSGAEIVVVDDGSTDGSVDFLARRRSRVQLHRIRGLGVARARNFGAGRSRGDVIVFADAHLGLDTGWWRPLLDQLEDPRVGAVAPAISRLPATRALGFGLTFQGPQMEVRWHRRRPKGPQAVEILPGCCLAMRRRVFEKTGGGFDGGLLQRGSVDNEVSVRLWLLGYELRIVPESVVRHLFREHSSVPLGWPEYLHNRLRLAFVHFSPDRLGRVVASLRNYPEFGEALTLLVTGDITARRQKIISRRVRDDDWFFRRFGLNW